MPPKEFGDTLTTRRKFLEQMGWAPVLFLPASLKSPLLLVSPPGIDRGARFPFSEVRLESHYSVRSRLDEIMHLAAPGTDEYSAEGYVAGIKSLMSGWG